MGPDRELVARYESAYFRQITLAQVGTALAVVTALFIAIVWIGSGFQPVYGFFLASTAAWAFNSLNYWVSDIPVSHWTWDRTVNAALDQFAVFLALFFHRLVHVTPATTASSRFRVGGSSSTISTLRAIVSS